MTTTVIIKAHCASDKEAVLSIFEGEKTVPIEVVLLQDGETAERYVYDNRTITVCECLKNVVSDKTMGERLTVHND